MTSGPESGRIVNVTVESLGDVLAADALTGDSTIVVTDAADFDELEGGTLAAGGSQYAYTAVDNDTGVLTLASTLVADLFAGDRVDVWDAALGEPAVDMTAFVELPGYQANDDAIPATVRHSLVPLIVEGIREPGQGETVRLERDGDSYEVVDVTGKKPTVLPQYGGAGISDRLVVNWYSNSPNITTDLPGSQHQISSWPSVFEQSGTAVGLNPAGDDGNVYLFEPGVYAVTMTLEVGNNDGAGGLIRLWSQVFDTTYSTSPFDVAFKDGDYVFPYGFSAGTSQVFYSEGGGVAAGGIAFGFGYTGVSNTWGQVWVEARIQRIS